ncbi:MAG: hypothetical protein ACJ75B_11570 [Flavisolibacter sp.]
MLLLHKASMIFCYGERKKFILPLCLIQVIFLFVTINATAQVKKAIDRSRYVTRMNDTVPKVRTTSTAVLTYQPPVTGTQQNPKAIDKELILQHYHKPDTTVKFQVIKNGAVVRTETSKLNAIRLGAGEKLILQPKKEITPVDQATVNKLRSVSSIQFDRYSLKKLPEVTIETKDSSNQQISYQLYFFPYEPFTYNDTSKKFQSRMGFFFLRSDSASAVNPIDPVNIIITSDDLKLASQLSLKIDHLNFPPTDVDLAGDDLSDSVEIRVITASRPEGYQTFLKIKPALEISTTASSLQGYGVQKIPVDVRMIGSTSADSIRVTLTPSKGKLTNESMMLRYNTPQIVYLTSAGTGQTLISAKSSNLESHLYLQYDFPWYFLLASLLGGLLGGFAQFFTGDNKKFSARPIVGGVFAGLVGAMAYYGLGISLLNFKFSAEMNEFSVLALSALFGYFGIPKSKPVTP